MTLTHEQFRWLFRRLGADFPAVKAEPSLLRALDRMWDALALAQSAGYCGA